MYRLTCFSIVFLLHLAGGCDTNSDSPTGPSTLRSISLGSCRVGLIVGPNQSCQSNMGTFEVAADGEGCLHDIDDFWDPECSYSSIRLRNANNSREFRASRIGGTNDWRIDVESR